MVTKRAGEPPEDPQTHTHTHRRVHTARPPARCGGVGCLEEPSVITRSSRFAPSRVVRELRPDVLAREEYRLEGRPLPLDGKHELQEGFYLAQSGLPLRHLRDD